MLHKIFLPFWQSLVYVNKLDHGDVSAGKSMPYSNNTVRVALHLSFSRRFYPKRLTVHSCYTCFCQYMCSLGIEPTTLALLTQCSTTEPQEHCIVSSSLLLSPGLVFLRVGLLKPMEESRSVASSRVSDFFSWRFFMSHKEFITDAPLISTFMLHI